MNTREELLKEHTKANALRIAAYAGANQQNFKVLMDCFLSNEYRLAQRAAWCVSLAADRSPELVMPYIKDLVAALTKEGVPGTVVRNSVRILQQLTIPEACQGQLMHTCFDFIQDPKTPAAIKAFSLTILYNLSQHYPEIKEELKLIIHERWDEETPAFQSRGRRILKMLNAES